ncbi:hypothetical protein THIOKS1500016 [Thiocapsa sp. KS1]|nr:hypothetical protein THIOKS1500016 [Thiocapsa sp. KS1]
MHKHNSIIDATIFMYFSYLLS